MRVLLISLTRVDPVLVISLAGLLVLFLPVVVQEIIYRRRGDKK